MNRQSAREFNGEMYPQAFDEDVEMYPQAVVEDADDTRKSNRIALLIGLFTIVVAGALVFSWREYLPYLWRGDNSVLIGVAFIIFGAWYSVCNDTSSSSASFCDGGLESFSDDYSDAGAGYF